MACKYSLVAASSAPLGVKSLTRALRSLPRGLHCFKLDLLLEETPSAPKLTDVESVWDRPTPKPSQPPSCIGTTDESRRQYTMMMMMMTTAAVMRKFICPNFLLLRVKCQCRFSKADVNKGVNRTTTCDTIIVICRDINASSSWGNLSYSLQNPRPHTPSPLEDQHSEVKLGSRSSNGGSSSAREIRPVQTQYKWPRGPVKLHRFVIDLNLKYWLASKTETQFFGKKLIHNANWARNLELNSRNSETFFPLHNDTILQSGPAADPLEKFSREIQCIVTV